MNRLANILPAGPEVHTDATRGREITEPRVYCFTMDATGRAARLLGQAWRDKRQGRPGTAALAMDTVTGLERLGLPLGSQPGARGLDLVARAKLLRWFFRGLGINRMGHNHGPDRIQVLAPRYSMAHSVNVNVPGSINHGHDATDRVECAICRRHGAVLRRVQWLILQAFPELNDRSDTQSDYFDFVFMVN